MRGSRRRAARDGPPRDDRGRRLRRAGRGRGDPPPRAGGRSRGRAAELSPPARCSRASRRGDARRRHRFPVEDKFDHAGAAERARRRARAASSAFLTVQEGCDKFCTFCVVPYTRGAEVSRPVAQIVAEAERLADAGVREVTLLGQNVNAYHGDGPDGRPWTLGAPAATRSPRSRASRGCATPPAIRATWTTSLIAAHRDLPSADALSASAGAVGLRPHPRRHEPPAHARRLSRARSSGCAPRGRTSRSPPTSSSAFRARREDDFDETLALVDEVGFAGAFSFKYSPRPGTPAAEMAEQVPEEVKSERLYRLQAADRPPAGRVQRALRRPHLRRAVRKARPASWPARRPLALSAAGAGHGAGISMIGEIAPVTITEIGANSLFGALARRTASGARPALAAAGGLMPLRIAPIGQRFAHRRPPSAKLPRPRSCSPSTTTGSPRSCSASTARTSR